jgi:hypothetical protein
MRTQRQREDALAKHLNEIAGILVAELFEAYHSAFYRYVDPAGKSLTRGTFRCVYSAALMRVAASLVSDEGMNEEDFLKLASESRRQELLSRNSHMM